MACQAIRADRGFCRNYAVTGTHFCHCHRNLSSDTLKQRWIIYAKSKLGIYLRDKQTYERCCSYLENGVVKMTQEDVLKLPATKGGVALYLILVENCICSPTAHFPFFIKCAQHLCDLQMSELYFYPIYNDLVKFFQKDRVTLLCFISVILAVAYRESYEEEDIEMLYPLLYKLLKCEAGKEFAMAAPDLLDIPQAVKKFFIPPSFRTFLTEEYSIHIKKLRDEVKAEKKARMAVFKEELMAKTWHPDRLWKYLEMGYEMDD